MDRGRKVVHQLADTGCETMERRFEEVHISDNCNNQRCNHASCAPFHVVVETIEPKSNAKQTQINYSYIQSQWICAKLIKNANYKWISTQENIQNFTWKIHLIKTVNLKCHKHFQKFYSNRFHWKLKFSNFFLSKFKVGCDIGWWYFCQAVIDFEFLFLLCVAQLLCLISQSVCHISEFKCLSK